MWGSGFHTHNHKKKKVNQVAIVHVPSILSSVPWSASMFKWGVHYDKVTEEKKAQVWFSSADI
jgi:hypothetical protein